MRQTINGILLLDKPIDMTSNQALQRVKFLFNAKKAGHTGSLDPIATGMLPICFGEATKFSQFLLESDKTYHVTAKLGIETTTGDSEGEIVHADKNCKVTLADVQKILPKFMGKIMQIPPMHSAIKFQGQPLYKLARLGIEIDRKPREVSIFSLQLERLVADELTLSVHCSKGTYIRTLIQDMGRALNSYAHVIALRRISVTPYGEDMTMYTLPALQMAAQINPSDLQSCLLPVETAVQVFPAIQLSTSAVFYIRMGQPVRSPITMHTQLVRLMSEDAKFLGMGEILADGRVKPHRMLSTQYS